MSSIRPNDRVVCIDTTPIPINAPHHEFTDFSYPGGFIEKGEIYCVTAVHRTKNGYLGLQLAGKPLFLVGHPSYWDSHRFRKIPLRSETTSATSATHTTA